MPCWNGRPALSRISRLHPLRPSPPPSPSSTSRPAGWPGRCRHGRRPGRHVGLLLPNIPEYLVALQAVWLTGATALQLSPLMVAEEVGHWLEATGCHIVVTLDLLAPAVMGSLERGPLEHVVLTSLARRMAMWRGMLYRIERLRRNGYLLRARRRPPAPLRDLLRATRCETPVEVDPEEDVAVLAPTGGTTASPKAVMLTHRNLVANAMQLRHWCGGDDGAESVLAVLPFFHSYGLTVSLLTQLGQAAARCTCIRASRRGPCCRLHRGAAADDRAGGAGHAGGPQQPDARQASTTCRSSAAVISGASALSTGVRARVRDDGVGNIVEGYGLTEASPVTHANPPGARQPARHHRHAAAGHRGPAGRSGHGRRGAGAARWANWWCAGRR